MHLETHPLSKQVPNAKLARSLWVYLTQKPHLVLVAPGAMFSPTPEIAEEKGWQYFRLCFAAVEEEEVEKSGKRFAEGVRTFWMIKRQEDLDDIEGKGSAEAVEGGLSDLGAYMAC